MTGSRLIVALDYADAKSALAFVASISPSQCRLKIGMELFTAAGPAIVSDLIARGFDIFLDLKYHDIPTTVARACAQAANLGVWMLNVHVLGGMKMLQAARQAIDQAQHKPLLIGVTLLTSHNDDSLQEIGLERGTETQVKRLASMAKTAGLDGVVCSPREASLLRQHFGQNFILVTPGVRPANVAADDQERTCTPAQAMVQGADYLVIGRPITRASQPMSVLTAINHEIQAP